MSNAVALGACLRMKSVPMVLTDLAASSTRISPPPGWVPTTRWLVTRSVSTFTGGCGVGGGVVAEGGVLSLPAAMPGPSPSIAPSAAVSMCRYEKAPPSGARGGQGMRGIECS